MNVDAVTLSRVASIVIGIIWIDAGGGKAMNMRRFVGDILSYRLVRKPVAIVVARLIVCLELTTGISLIIDLQRRLWLSVTIGLVGLFTVLILSRPNSALRKDCGCGRLLVITGRHTVIRNVVIIVVAGVAMSLSQ